MFIATRTDSLSYSISESLNIECLHLCQTLNHLNPSESFSVSRIQMSWQSNITRIPHQISSKQRTCLGIKETKDIRVCWFLRAFTCVRSRNPFSSTKQLLLLFVAFHVNSLFFLHTSINLFCQLFNTRSDGECRLCCHNTALIRSPCILVHEQKGLNDNKRVSWDYNMINLCIFFCFQKLITLHLLHIKSAFHFAWHP